MLTVVSSDPSNNATGVYIDKIITVTFSKAIYPHYVDAEFIKLYKITTEPGKAPNYQLQMFLLNKARSYID